MSAAMRVSQRRLPIPAVARPCSAIAD